MRPFSAALQEISEKCSLCHDQCVSACPVVEFSHSQIAYPSRLAALSAGVSTGTLQPSNELLDALLFCINCNACTDSCVYVDNPVDVTPLIRWAREYLVEASQGTGAMRQLHATIQLVGNPYADVGQTYAKLGEGHPSTLNKGGTLLIADASELASAPELADTAIELLEKMGYPRVALSDSIYTGWDLWQYGYREDAIKIAESILREIQESQPEVIVPLSSASAYMLRTIYPGEFGISIPAAILTVPEAILARLETVRVTQQDLGCSVFLVFSHTETHQLHSLAARQVLERLGVTCVNPGYSLAHHGDSFPEVSVPALAPIRSADLASRIAEAADIIRPERVICTSGSITASMRKTGLRAPVSNWVEYVNTRIRA